MPIKFACPSCKNTLSVPDEMAGKVGKCKCGQQVKVPRPKAKSAAGSKAAAPVSGGPSAALFDELTESDYQRKSPYESLYSPKKSAGGAEQLKRFEDEEKETKKAVAGTSKAVMTVAAILSVLLSIGSFALIALYGTSSFSEIQKHVLVTNLSQQAGAAVLVVLGIGFLAGAVGVFIRHGWGWVVLAALFEFLVFERLAVIGFGFADGFDQVRFFAGMIPMVAVLALTAFIFKSETRELYGLKSVMPAVIAGVLGLALAGAIIGTAFAAKKQQGSSTVTPSPRVSTAHWLA